METILLVDDEIAVLGGQRNILTLNGYAEIREAQTFNDVQTILQAEPIALVLLDLTLEHGSGLQILEYVRDRYPETVVVVITGASDISTAVQCMRAGAYDFLVKGSDTARIPSVVKNALEHRRVLTENALLHGVLAQTASSHPESFSAFITNDEYIRRILVYLAAIAPLPDPVLITGETGVGKELIARGVHTESGRTGEFVPVNLGGLDDHAFTDTLFGHRKGAFTGADTRREGLVARASNGTLFLDEIGEMPIESQSRLLRLLDSGEYLPLGVDTPSISHARVVCATNRDLETAVAEGRFRRDLYFRISVHHVAISPLRERRGDIPLIAQDILVREARRVDREQIEVLPEIIDALAAAPLPGNVRELHQIVLRALLTGEWAVGTGVTGVGTPTTTAQETGAQDRGVPKNGLQETGDSVRDEGGVPETSVPAVGEVADDVAFGPSLPTPGALIEHLLREADRRYPGSRIDAATAIGLSPQAFANRWKRMEERG